MYMYIYILYICIYMYSYICLCIHTPIALFSSNWNYDFLKAIFQTSIHSQIPRFKKQLPPSPWISCHLGGMPRVHTHIHIPIIPNSYQYCQFRKNIAILLSYPIHTNILVWSTISYGLPFFGDFSCGDPDQLINQRVGKGHLWRITQFQKHHSDYNWSYTPHHIAIFPKSRIRNPKTYHRLTVCFHGIPWSPPIQSQ
jgi:hypothetical protein